MKILFCNIAYMNQYVGNIEQDIPKGGGAWVAQHKDAGEKWNFLNVNGNCYGFVMNQSDQFHIERLEGTSKQEVQAEDVTVVWCALKDADHTVIVGWYEHATVYRYYQESIVTPFGLDREYFVKAKADDCYLLPEDHRTYPIGRAAIDGAGHGFGQSNFWYADSEYAKENIVPSVMEYLQASKPYRINRTCASFEAPANVNIPLTEQENLRADQHYDSAEYQDFLPLGYRAFHATPNGDNAFFLATSLRFLHQYSAAIEWYRKTIEIEGESWDTVSCLPYLLTECQRFAEAMEIAEHLLSFPEAAEDAAKHELYSIIADCNLYLGNIPGGIAWLDKIIAESKDDALIQYTKNTKANWLNL